MYNRAFRPWALAALSGLLLMTACEDTSTVPTEVDPQLAKGGIPGKQQTVGLAAHERIECIQVPG